jgi:hypothetical protein
LFAGVWITGAGTSDNAVAGNFLGTDINGTQPVTDSFGNVFGGGVAISAGASGNRVGTDGKSVDDTGERNVIAGSDTDAIDIYGVGTDSNVVAGNFIGTDVTGTRALGIAGNGVFLAEGASSNCIGINPVGGAALDDEGNVISGTDQGVLMGDGANANIIAGNKIGTDATGRVALGNRSGGIQIESGASSNTIGGTGTGAGNLITDNGVPGVAVGASASDTATVGDEIIGNSIFANTGQAIDLGYDGVTDNGAAPRSGPNNLQNFPIILTTADGSLQGWLGGSAPDTTYRIDVFASAAYGPGDSGAEQEWLGSVEVTTGAIGAVTFAVPFTAPAGLPSIAATATDPEGNTSEVSSSLPGSFQAESQVDRLAPGRQPLVFAAAKDDGIDLQDPSVGSSDLTWDLSLSVETGTLMLSSTAGLVGSGDGTGSLFYSGTLTALDAAMDGMIYTAPAGSHGNASLSVGAQSESINLLAGQVIITTGSFLVTTTADGGAGSLRQAILDSNVTPGGTNTINFAIPGTGVQTIAPLSPLPATTYPVLIDGTTQPGYAGAPLIAIVGQGTTDPDPLNVGPNLAVAGVALGGASFSSVSSSTMLAVESVPLTGIPARPVTYQVVVGIGEGLLATVEAAGARTSLLLLDAEGHIVMRSDGLSQAQPIDAIETYVGPGTYSLQVQEVGGTGSFTLNVMMAPSNAPYEPIPLSGQVPTEYEPEYGMVAGDFTGDGKLDLAVAYDSYYPGFTGEAVWVFLGNGDGTFQPPVPYALTPFNQNYYPPSPPALVAGDFTGNGHLDLAVSTDNASGAGIVAVLLGNGDGTFQPAVSYAVGSDPLAIVARDFTRRGHLDLAVSDSDGIQMLAGNGDGTFQPAKTVVAGIAGPLVAGDFDGDGRLDLAVAGSYFNHSVYKVGAVSVLLGNGDGTFKPQVTYAVASYPDVIVAADFAGNGRLDLAVGSEDAGSSSLSVLLGNGDGTFQPAVSYALSTQPNAILAGDFTGDGRLDLAVVSIGTQLLVGNGDGTFQPAVTVSTLEDDDLVAGDFNGDRRLDLAVVGYENGSEAISVLLGNGNGTFQSPEQNAVGSGASAIVAGDFTGDGRTDLATADFFSNTVSVLLGNGDGTFQPAREYSVGRSPISIVAGDFNGDGRIDIAVSDSDGVQVLLGNGDGTFQPATTVAAGIIGSLVDGDFNGDGKLDLAVAVGFAVDVLLGNGDGTFQPAQAYTVADRTVAIVAGEFEGGGRVDLATAGSGLVGFGEVSVLLGNGDGTFQPAKTFAVGTYPVSLVAGSFLARPSRNHRGSPDALHTEPR